MANTKSRSRSKRRYAIFWLIISLISGGGVSGYFNPDWPVVGPLIKTITSSLLVDGTIPGELNPPPGGYVPGPNQNLGQNQNANLPPSNGGGPAPQPAWTRRPPDKLLISSFNIQVFGTSKIAKPNAMSVITQVIRQFDIVAIQEIRSQDDDILPRLMAMLNADGSRYEFLIGPRIGRTISTEQYAFIYDANRVEHDPSSVGTIGDPADLLHREPMVARFRPRTSTPERAFTFWLINTHTDPDEVDQEVAALAQVFEVMRSARQDEDDVILLGDLNANEFELGPIAQIPGIQWAVRGGMTTNTRRTKAYDNIIFHGPSTNEFTGRWGVFDFENAFGLTREQALQVSDHFPVWAEFQIWEAPAAGHFAGNVSIDRR